VRAREFPISAVRFIQEMGDGVFGKMYRGELGGIVGRFSVSTSFTFLNSKPWKYLLKKNYVYLCSAKNFPAFFAPIHISSFLTITITFVLAIN
jgi:hypothetical protein